MSEMPTRNKSVRFTVVGVGVLLISLLTFIELFIPLRKIPGLRRVAKLITDFQAADGFEGVLDEC